MLGLRPIVVSACSLTAILTLFSACGGGSQGPGPTTVTPTCPSSCDDSNACTTDKKVSGSGCNLKCSYDPITACASGDSCCPSGCTPDTDGDCTATTLSSVPDNRRVDWAPGILGGIQLRSEICKTIDAKSFGDGSTDAADEIQSAIDACPAGQVLKIPSGNYKLSKTLNVNKGITIRGEGPSGTRLLLDNAGAYGVIQIGTEGPMEQPGTAVEGGMSKGSTKITVSDASGFKVGDLVRIDQTDDGETVLTGDCTWFKRTNDGPRSMGQISLVKAINGKEIELDSPLHVSFDAAFKPELSLVNPNGTVDGAGVEDLYASRTSDLGGQGNMIRISSSSHSWVKNVETEKVSGRHIQIESCYRCVVRDSYVHDAWNNNPGGTGYGISLMRMTSDSLVENNVVIKLNIPVLFEVSGGGNVVGYNYVDDSINDGAINWMMASINTHCSFPHHELIEGNHVSQIASDNVHGGSGYLTIYRNYATGKTTNIPNDNNFVAIDLEASAFYANVVGNVLLTPETVDGKLELTKENCSSSPYAYRLGGWFNGGTPCDLNPKVAETLIRHGNYDYATKALSWDEKITDHTLPASLYLTAKPAFFGDTRFPAVDPEADEKVVLIPAKVRYDKELKK